MEKLLFILPWLGLGRAAADTPTGPWSCSSQSSFSGRWIKASSLTVEQEPATFVFGVKGFPPVIISIGAMNAEASSDCELALCDRGRTAASYKSARGDHDMTREDGVPCPPGVLSGDTMRYFWLRVIAADAVTRVEVGRQGQSEKLLGCPVFGRSWNELWFKLSGGPVFWLYNCTVPPPQPTLGCLHRTLTKRYDFSITNPISEERVILPDGTKAIRFLVRGLEDAHVRLRSPLPDQYYEIDLNFVGKIAVQQGIKYKEATSCFNCLSADEFRLYTVMYNQTDLWLLEGKNPKPRVSVSSTPGSSIYNITSISFASMASADTVMWLHGCRGEEAALQVALKSTQRFSAPDTSVVLDALRPGAKVSANQSALESVSSACRVVHSFKYHFDQYFALSEDGVVNGSSTMLAFRVLGRKDIHLQLVGDLPPSTDLYYEIDLDFYNHTNIDRARELKVASVRHFGLLSPKELRGFLLEHNSVSGDISITSDDGKTIISWRDPKPFPLRYFSVSSGSSAGNDTTWVFGCPRHPPTPHDLELVSTGCSRPIFTHVYSHSQYFSLEREGVLNGSVRTISFFLRANSSGHIRLENVLPPAVDAMFEVDIAHQGLMGIDSWGRSVASLPAPAGLLSDKQLRGFWIRHDLAKRSLEVGKRGQNEPLIAWTAPLDARFLPIRFVSFTTSRVAGNATWVYGCKGDAVPRGAHIESESSEGSDFDEESFDYSYESPTILPRPRHHTKQQLRSILVNVTKPPPVGTVIRVQLTVEKVYLDDIEGTAVIRGFFEALWKDASMMWNPNEYDNIQALQYVATPLFWTPDFYMYKGGSELSGVLHLNHDGIMHWEAAAHLEAHCPLDGRHWPQDEHQCELLLGLGVASTSRKLSLRLLTEGPTVKPLAAAPLWDLRELSVELQRRDGPQTPAAQGNNTIRIEVTLRRNAPVFQKILLAPYIVLSAMCMLAYWVHEPLPRDKVILGCFALVLLVLSFIVLEAACPPGLNGVPLIVDLYCWCLALVVVNVALSAVVSAIARECPVRHPPRLLCRLLTAPLTAWVLLLPMQQVQLMSASGGARADAVGYTNGSSQVYVRSLFDGDTLCSCSDGACSRQSDAEARQFWSLLAVACERISSLLCWVFLIVAVCVLS